jgi:hypothetical protein
MADNQNILVTNGWSNPDAATLYATQWPVDPVCRALQEECRQCGGCSFFAPFNADWGLCCHPKSRHHLETVFEHFTCPNQVNEGWGPHSFTEDTSLQCRCGGHDSEYWDRLTAILSQTEKPVSDQTS